MSESWGPHDVGGQEGGPVDLSEHDIAHWEWQIDAMVRLALSKGLISDFAELRDGIERLTPEDYENFTYYERWAKSLAYTLVSRGIISEVALAEKARAIRDRQQAEAAS
ncbi:MAG: nitrile hydratase subunit beta [Proteobacteria bacterium]|nr:nitrile hydratase subunit beta [Pseudomonadota bacterium]